MGSHDCHAHSLDLHYLQITSNVPSEINPVHSDFLLAEHFHRLDQLAELSMDVRRRRQYKIFANCSDSIHYCFQHILCGAVRVFSKRMGDYA